MSPRDLPRWSQEDKPRDLRAAMSALLVYMGRDRRSVYAGVTCAIASTVLSLIGPQYLADITDSISASILGSIPIDMQYIAGLTLLLALLYAFSFILSVTETCIIAAASERIGDRMRRDLLSKFNRLPLSYLERHSTGDLMSRMSNDTDAVRTGSAESFSITISAFCMIGGSLAMMVYTEWRLALLAAIPTVIGTIGMYVIVRRSQKHFVAQQRDLGSINEIVEESYYGHDIVRTYNGTGMSIQRFGLINDHLLESSFKARVVTSMMPLMMDFIGNLGYVIVCIAGSILVMEGSIGYGVIVAFIVYIRRFNQPVSELADTIARMQSVASASERVFAILSMDDMPPSPANPEVGRSRGEVEFRDVHFSYSRDREIIHGFNLSVKPGQRIAIVGPTGAGKTTLANLLVRFYDPDSGEILIDGVPTTSMSRDQVRNQFATVLQDPWMSEGSYLENVAFTSGATREDVRRACEMVGIDVFISSLPEGYDTLITESSGLSAGQRQQLAIARAIVKNAPMIILDEATSSVDTQTERKIQDAMVMLMEGRTSFIIAHRLSTIRNADMIIVMREGSVVEQGTHDELIKLDGFYKMLHDSQFEGCV